MKRNNQIAIKVFQAAIAIWIIVRRLQKELGRQSQAAISGWGMFWKILWGQWKRSNLLKRNDTRDTEEERKSGQSEECPEKLVTSTWPILPCSCLALLPRTWNLSEGKSIWTEKASGVSNSGSRVHSKVIAQLYFKQPSLVHHCNDVSSAHWAVSSEHCPVSTSKQH